MVLTNNPDAQYYGTLSPGTNPTGDINHDGQLDQNDAVRGAWKEPLFKGGDRFFPDATLEFPGVGRNVVRVRAEVKGLNVGDTVWFRSFDVDDPSDDSIIDPNGENGNDNRGRLAAIHAPGASQSPKSGGFAGRLRAVNAEDQLGDWAAPGVIVDAKVKDVNGMLVAEVDLATSFAPGDNFRVVASTNDPNQKDALDGLRVDRPGGPLNVATTGGLTNARGLAVSPQLSVWRYLHVENDTADQQPFALMNPNTVNRQNNRFADAYLEPEYASIAAINKNHPAPVCRHLSVNPCE